MAQVLNRITMKIRNAITQDYKIFDDPGIGVSCQLYGEAQGVERPRASNPLCRNLTHSQQGGECDPSDILMKEVLYSRIVSRNYPIESVLIYKCHMGLHNLVFALQSERSKQLLPPYLFLFLGQFLIQGEPNDDRLPKDLIDKHFATISGKEMSEVESIFSEARIGKSNYLVLESIPNLKDSSSVMPVMLGSDYGNFAACCVNKPFSLGAIANVAISQLGDIVDNARNSAMSSINDLTEGEITQLIEHSNELMGRIKNSRLIEPTHSSPASNMYDKAEVQDIKETK